MRVADAPWGLRRREEAARQREAEDLLQCSFSPRTNRRASASSLVAAAQPVAVQQPQQSSSVPWAAVLERQLSAADCKQHCRPHSANRGGSASSSPRSKGQAQGVSRLDEPRPVQQHTGPVHPVHGRLYAAAVALQQKQAAFAEAAKQVCVALRLTVVLLRQFGRSSCLLSVFRSICRRRCGLWQLLCLAPSH